MGNVYVDIVDAKFHHRNSQTLFAFIQIIQKIFQEQMDPDIIHFILIEEH